MAGPKGKLSKGGAGDLGGALEKNCGPTWQRFFNQRIARCIVYRRPTLAAHSFPSLRRFLPRRTCLLATGKNSAGPKRTFRSALVSADCRAKGKMIERGRGGSGGGTSRGWEAPPDS